MRRHRRKARRSYELTDWGRKLEPILLALGDWGIDAPQPPAPTALSATSVLIFLQGAARPDPAAPPTTCRLELDGRVWTVRLASGRAQVQPGEPATADVSLRTEPKTLSGLLADPATLATACADGSVAVVGDLSAIHRLLHAVTDPWTCRRSGGCGLSRAVSGRSPVRRPCGTVRGTRPGIPAAVGIEDLPVGRWAIAVRRRSNCASDGALGFVPVERCGWCRCLRGSRCGVGKRRSVCRSFSLT